MNVSTDINISENAYLLGISFLVRVVVTIVDRQWVPSVKTNMAAKGLMTPEFW
jgi:hypothetical protein